MTHSYQGLRQARSLTLAGAVAVLLALVGCGGDSKKNEPPVVEVAVVGDIHHELSIVELDASGSSDPEGKELTFSWTQSGGPEVMLEGADTATPSFMAPKVVDSATFEFQVTVSDGRKEAAGNVSVDVMERNYVVFSTNIDGNADDAGVFLTTVEGGEPQELTSKRGIVQELTVSPDRRRVAFVMDTDPEDASTCQSLFLADVGSSAEMIFDCNAEFDDTIENADRMTDGVGDGRVFKLLWSPSGAELAFIAEQSYQDEGLRNVMVWKPGDGVMNLTGIEFEDADSSGTPDQSVGFAFEWSPDGGHIAYSYQFEHNRLALERLYVISPNGSGGPLEVSDFSQDIISNSLLYAAPRGDYLLVTNEDAAAGSADDMSIYGKSVADSDVDADGVPDGTLGAFAFSANGKLMYIADTSTQGTPELHIVNVDGSEHRRVTNISLTDVNEDGKADTDLNFDARADEGVLTAKWSPDGSMIAYRATKEILDGFFIDTPIRREYIHTPDSADTDIVIVGDPDAPELSSSGDYHWSPDGNVLLFGMTQVFVSTEFRVYDIDAGVVQSITSMPGTSVSEFVGWTVSGDPLVILDPARMPMTPFVLPLDGSGNQTIMADGSIVEAPYSLSPDGAHFAFSFYNDASGLYDAAFVEIGEDGGETFVTRTSLDNWGGAFSPDGTRFVGFHWDDAGMHWTLDSVKPDGTGLVERVSTEVPAGFDGVVDYRVFGRKTTIPAHDGSSK